MRRFHVFVWGFCLFAAGLPAQSQFRGDAAHTGAFVSAKAPTLARVKWAFATPAPILSSPAVADGVVYFGSDDERLYAVDAATGREKWKVPAGGPVRSSPAV